MTVQKSISTQSWGLLLLLSLLWGASFLSITISLEQVGPFTSVAHRVFWAMILLWAVVFVTRKPVPTSALAWVGLLGMGVLNNVIPFSLMAWGQLHIESGLTAILNSFTAVIGVVIAAIFLADEKLTAQKLIGAVLGFVGVAVAIGLDNLTKFNVTSLAQLAVIAGTVSYACAGVWARKTIKDVSPIVAAAGMLTGSTLVMVPLALMIEGPFDTNLTLRTWAALGYISIAATAGAYLIYYRLLAQIGSGNLMVVTLLVVPIAIVLGALVLGEQLLPQALIGFAILAVGLLVIDGRLIKRIFR